MLLDDPDLLLLGLVGLRVPDALEDGLADDLIGVGLVVHGHGVLLLLPVLKIETMEEFILRRMICYITSDSDQTAILMCPLSSFPSMDFGSSGLFSTSGG